MTDLVRPVNLKKPIVNRKLIAWVFVITGIFSVILWLIGQKNLGLWSIFKPTVVTFDLKPQKLPVVPANTNVSDSKLMAQVQDSLSKLDGEFSVYVYRPKTNVGYGIDANKVMPAASIIKVPIMIAVLKKVEAGIINLDDTYSLQDSDRRDGGPISGMATGTSLTVHYLLQQMGLVSDNTAPVILVNLVGADYVQSTLSSLGMTNSNFAQNTVTASDLNQMWRSLYQGNYLNAQSLALLEQNLTQTSFEDRIPAGLPTGTKVVHKVGSGDNLWSDTAVITGQGGKTLYLTILDNSVSLGQIQAAFPDIVKTIWNYESLQ